MVDSKLFLDRIRKSRRLTRTMVDNVKVQLCREQRIRLQGYEVSVVYEQIFNDIADIIERRLNDKISSVREERKARRNELARKKYKGVGDKCSGG